MYIPAPFRESDRSTLYDFIEAHPLAVLVTAMANGHAEAPYATHLPLHLDRAAGVLRGHIARANPHVERLRAAPDGSVPALTVFSGVDHYITPGWYPSKQEHAKVVPTWNYIAVHVQGPVTLHDDHVWLETHLAQLTDTHEATQAHPWAMHDAPDEYLAAQMRAIVGVTVRIEALEGKYKVSQNRSDADITGVEHGLESLDTPASRAMEAAVRARRPVR